MTVVQCRSCQHVMSPDPDGRLPPWCPVCGADLKAKPGEPAAAPVEEDAAGPDDAQPVAQRVAQAVVRPPMVLPADEPGPGYYQRSPRGLSAYEDGPARPPLSWGSKLGMVLGVVGGVVAGQIVTPHVFPQPPEGFNVQQVMLAAVFGGMGAALGALLGKLIDGMRS